MRLFPDLRTPQKTTDILLEYRTGDTIVGDYPDKKEVIMRIRLYMM